MSEWQSIYLAFDLPLGRAKNKTWFHQLLRNNYINPLMPQFNGSTGDHPEALSNPGSAVRLL